MCYRARILMCCCWWGVSLNYILVKAQPQPLILLKEMVAYYPFNGNANDEMGNGFDLNVTTQTFVQDPNGKPDGALMFQNDAETIIKRSQILSIRDFTIAVWAKLSSQGIKQGLSPWILGKSTPGQVFGIGTEKPGLDAAGGSWRFQYGEQELIARTLLKPETWTHLVFTVSSDNIKCYVNGVLEGQMSVQKFVSIRFDQIAIGGRGKGVAEESWVGSVDNIRFYYKTLDDSEVKTLYQFELNPSYPRTATAIAIVFEGKLVGARLTDIGYGYTNRPMVTISGGGGVGAKAVASYQNGIIDGLLITQAGSDYTNSPTIIVDPPPFPPRRAEAFVQIQNGLVVGATVSDPGHGYEVPPVVLVTGGGGIGASAVASISDGKVTGIAITHPGNGYTSLPTVKIASPPFSPEVSVDVSRVIVTLKVVLGGKYHVESSHDMLHWSPAGPAFIAEDEKISQEFQVDASGRYFRIHPVP